MAKSEAPDRGKPVPTISVIVAACNQEKYIGRCIRSLLNQTIPRRDYEIVVVNDGSTDKTDYVLSLFEDDIRVLQNKEKAGLPASLNSAIRAARGQFVVRVDGDDYVHAQYLNALSMFLELNKDIDAVACDYRLVDDHENVLAMLDCMEHPIGCGIMFRIEQLIDIGLYDEGFLIHEDKDLRIRFEQKYRVHRAALPLYRYRRHDNNMTNDAATTDAYLQRLQLKHPK